MHTSKFSKSRCTNAKILTQLDFFFPIPKGAVGAKIGKFTNKLTIYIFIYKY